MEQKQTIFIPIQESTTMKLFKSILRRKKFESLKTYSISNRYSTFLLDKNGIPFLLLIWKVLNLILDFVFNSHAKSICTFFFIKQSIKFSFKMQKHRTKQGYFCICYDHSNLSTGNLWLISHYTINYLNIKVP